MDQEPNTSASNSCFPATLHSDLTKCANPHLLPHIAALWLDSKRKNQKIQFNYAKAYKSILAYPVPIAVQDTMRECVQLEGIGPVTAKKLFNLCTNNHQDQAHTLQPEHQKQNSAVLDGCGDSHISKDVAEVAVNTKRQKSRKKTSIYIPKYKSAPFALLIGLYKAAIKHGLDSYIAKRELIQLSLPYYRHNNGAVTISNHTHNPSTSTSNGNSNSTNNNNTSSSSKLGDWFNLWAGIKTLEKYQYVKRKSPTTHRFVITENMGMIAAQKIVLALLMYSNSGSPGVTDEQLAGTKNPDTDDDINLTHEDIEIFKLGERLYSETNSDVGIGTNTNATLTKANAGHLIDMATDTSRKGDYDTRFPADLESLIDDRFVSAFFCPKESDIIATDMPMASLEASEFSPIMVEASTYSITLLIDNREIRSSVEREYTLNTLLNYGITDVEITTLPVGDYAWIARPKSTICFDNPGSSSITDSTNFSASRACTTITSSDAIILDTLIERKTYDDLYASIIDGRISEQKNRLLNCGVDNIIYILEGCSTPVSATLPAGTTKTKAKTTDSNPIQGTSGTGGSSGGRYDHFQRSGEDFVYETVNRLTINSDIRVKKLLCYDETLCYLSKITKHYIKKSQTDHLYVLHDKYVTSSSINSLKLKLSSNHLSRNSSSTGDSNFYSQQTNHPDAETIRKKDIREDLNKGVIGISSGDSSISNPKIRLLIFYDSFARISQKSLSLSIQEMFAQSLFSIRGISKDKLFVLLKKFSTPIDGSNDELVTTLYCTGIN
ncbi:Crossover junction endonuclease mus-81 [Zancudomyces culisetae]|uniref:Crossover junction endonuclease MUS81 n=1 Tax=Zancudomyces culisetae TaxID=1213189 RepID=A0A1R1PRI4_ZANCU|nr:Crossover junction endonuclease mus-81 [Zancudomyces culisetae]|eukprot:OMH83600.1 Crossover junction endonuclease mus-81 [Zancudomyces culisetae]